MKNLKYFPFERNRYFYGKFLSVDDFEAEQRYMNDKRRMINRFLHGVGVVCGMQVVEVDDLTISLEAGLALDFSGREIVVASPVTKRLSSIDGFSKYGAAEENRQNLYLCIEYDEEVEEPVHNIIRESEEQGEEYNKYAEGYRLFVTSEEPEQEGNQMTAMYEETRTVFEGNGIRIRQKVPKYIQSGMESEITIFVEKIEQEKEVSFSYQMRLACMEQNGENTITISFDEKEYESARNYVFKQKIRAKTVTDVEGYVEAVRDSFSLTIGQETRKDLVWGKFTVTITDMDLSETILKNYYNAAMKDILKDYYGQAIYLAKMEVIRAGDTYVIEGIENLPYRQCVWNNTLSSTMETLRLRQQKTIEQKNLKQMVSIPQNVTVPDVKMEVRTGSIMMDLGIGGIPGQRFYSEEIVHGLGLGEVVVSLGIVKGTQESNQVIYGSQNVFEENVCPKVEMAAKVNMARGSFVIGIKCLEPVEMKRIRVCWMAVKDKVAQMSEEKQISMSVCPDMVHLQVRGKYYFEAVINNEVQKHIKWSVKGAESGEIDANGAYTAPNQPGVYEIVAESMANEQMRASAYAIVRDEMI